MVWNDSSKLLLSYFSLPYLVWPADPFVYSE